MLEDGRVKVRLVVHLDGNGAGGGRGVDRCAGCRVQFKDGQEVGIGERCGHAVHDRCLKSWGECLACEKVEGVGSAGEVQ